ncbi:MAG TPA: STAS domain-containing protein [Tepidisphaeraceae bacterium]|jgi:anti-anti-sigma factor|nr:STAS domain-containing protein [Tepidisphaeraceae bacterium]
MKLSLVSIEKAGFVHLAAEGEITSRDFGETGKNPLEEVLGATWPGYNIMLSLEKTGFLDSSALGWLINSQRQCKEKGGKFVLHSAPPRVREVFDLLKMRAVLNLKDNEAAAREVFAAGAGVNGDSK